MRRILIVDDDISSANVIAAALRGYDVTLAHNGLEALAIAEARPPFDLLITDYLMPSITGDELARRFRIAFPFVKTMLLSAFADFIPVQAEVADARLPKPYSVARLRRTVDELIGPPAPPLMWECDCGVTLECHRRDINTYQTCDECGSIYHVGLLGAKMWRVTLTEQRRSGAVLA